MIYSIGIDIVYIPRIVRILHIYGEKFLTKICTAQEIKASTKYHNNTMLAKHFAKRFAAKEACVKALGNACSKNMRMKYIEVYNDLTGRPYISIKQDLLSRNYIIHLSLSDDGEYATAFVIASHENPATL
ncbi:holo-[acyl-carrier-protein] synthase [Wolbachia endosymbiont of Howardula sp.]|uniref:holo-[acyl-carrier-protein] synthase n=1 Tax=Wolbachia endosymbiont of Howardula sp. TaxID=2916816 RepID=UPI00217EB790|nr:holo-[acyl-carrier-protein] synthase [Wolbachia endosymbiont of Howardula sp.]UWI83089.1 holo-[acyl-carrier-protein] synthase [Wolbachia endosymbiont of Howardula sp.]